MDSEATRRKRLEDIEAKRKRLEEMRKSRAAPSTTTTTTAVLVDTMIHSSPLRQSLQKGLSSEGQMISNVNKTENHNTIDATNELVNALLQNSPHSIEDHMTNVEPKVVVPVKSREELLNEKIQSFSIVKNVSNTVSILPLIPVTYEKGIQTGERDHDDIEEEEHYDDNDRLTNPPLSSKVDSHQILDDKIQGTNTPSTVETIDKAVLSLSVVGTTSTSVASMKLTDAQRSNVITSKDFIFFLSKSSLLVERALSISESHIDLLKDFSIDDRGQNDNQSNSNDKVLQLSSSSSYDSDITAGRPVMDLKWSHLIPDLFLVAYGSKASSSSSSSSSSLSSFGMSYSSQASMVNSIHSSNSSNSRGGGGGGSSSLGNEDIPGLVCVWSKDLHTRPEFRFIASSPILSALFHTSEQHIIVGGCYSGQILVWDMRVQSGKSISMRELPVQKSSITGRGHKQPVYAMSMIISPSTSTSSTSSLTSSSGASSSSSSSSMMIIYELLSISTDGLLCRWDITRLVEPLSCSFLFSDLGTSIRSSLMMSFSNTDYSSSGPLHIGSSSSSNSSNNAVVIGPQFNISAMAVRSMDSMIISSSHEATNDVLFGSGSGLLIRSAVPFKEGCPAAWKVDGHIGLITSIQMHPSRNSKYSNLVLTSSLDWTVKLWNLDDFTKPLLEFSSSSYDYVCDVQWSLINPAVFVTLTSGGKVSLWNLSRSTSEPVDVLIIDTSKSVNLSTSTSLSSSSVVSSVVSITSRDDSKRENKIALNKAIWTRDGQSILVGDSSGTLHVIKVLSSSSSSSALSSADESRFDFALVHRRTGILDSSNSTQQVSEQLDDALIAVDDDTDMVAADLFSDSSMPTVKDSLEDLSQST